MEFEEIAAVCKWRIIARGDHACKACIQQPNGQECCKDNCAPYQFVKTMRDETREDLHNIVENLVDQWKKVSEKTND